MFKNLNIIFVLILIILILLLSLMNIHFSYNSDNNLLNINRNWNLIVYFSGDNDLSEHASKNLGLIKSIGSTNEFSIITLIDEHGDENTRLGKVEFRNYNETALNNLDQNYTTELNLGESETLEDFITWSMDNYPAQHYCLIIWGHGIGCDGVGPDSKDY